MKYVDEFRDKSLVKQALDKILSVNPKGMVRIMEVCGTHTHNFRRFGLNSILPENITLVSGPGCPVCVSSQGYIDSAVRLARKQDVIIATFGDMLRVPGTDSNLEEERSKGSKVSVVYSALEALNIARRNPKRKVIFLAVGFETTAPTIAFSILAAKKENIDNVYFYCALKLIPPVMTGLLRDKRLKLSGFLCPGHVSAIIGVRPYHLIARKFGIPCCIAGFEPLDILEGLYFILRQIKYGRAEAENQYTRAVREEGNPRAKALISKVFEVADASWRGLGRVGLSGLEIKKEFSRYDARVIFGLSSNPQSLDKRTGCRCADVLKGIISPATCPLFSRVCNSRNPKGPCMVSQEGACYAHYKYK